MLNNLINYEDVRRVVFRLKISGFSFLKDRLLKKRIKRVAGSWNRNNNFTSSWDIIPKIVARRNKIITSGRFFSYREYFAEKYLKNKEGLVALSPGCGNGGNEIKWAKLKLFKKINAFDISENRISAALNLAKLNKLEDVIDFYVSDIINLKHKYDKYDIVFFEGSLHHMSPISEVLSYVKKMLKPNGILLIYDFFGPSRFQWTDLQMEIAKSFLETIPEKYRIMIDGKIKKTIYKPGRIKMYLADPSEASESSEILSN